MKLRFLFLISLIIMNIYQSVACTIIAVGKKASSDQSVIISHTDTGPDSRIFVVSGQNLQTGRHGSCLLGHSGCLASPLDDGIILGYIPQVEKTYKYFQSAYSHVNEYQLGIAESTTVQRSELICTRENGEQIMTIEQAQIFALQRYKTAKEAVKFIGELMTDLWFSSIQRRRIRNPCHCGYRRNLGPGDIWSGSRLDPGQWKTGCHLGRTAIA